MSMFIHVDTFKLFGLMLVHAIGIGGGEEPKEWKFKYHRSKNGKVHTFTGSMEEWKRFKQSPWYRDIKRT